MTIKKYGYCLMAIGLLYTLQSCYQALSQDEKTGISTLQALPDTTLHPFTFGFGRLATQAEIDKLDIDVRPDGKGLPAGSGISSKGKLIFEAKCVACHGAGGIGGPNGSLVKTPTTDEQKSKRAEKTIGNYWPYATTVKAFKINKLL